MQTLYSVRQAAEHLQVKPHVVRNHMRRLNLGQKVGDWNIVLTQSDLSTLRRKLTPEITTRHAHAHSNPTLEAA